MPRLRTGMSIQIASLALGAILLVAEGRADEPPLPLVVEEDFEKAADRWRPFDPGVWRVEMMDGGHVYGQFKKTTSFQPPHRSPLLISMLKDVDLSDFELTVRVCSTHELRGNAKK